MLGALVLVYVSNQWARALPASLVNFNPAAQGRPRDFMNVELGLDELRYGFVSSYGFTALYSLASLVAGVACDRLPRGAVLLTATAGWSAATALQSISRGYGQLLGARALLGFSQAFCTPAALPMIAERFSARRRAVAGAIYSSGIYLGYALASSSVILTSTLGWRATSVVVSAFSAAMVPTLWLALRGSTPATSTAAAPSPPPPVERPLHSVLRVRSVLLLLVAVAFRSFAGYAVGAWSFPFYRQYFPECAATFASLNAVMVAVVGTLSTVSGGVLSDRLAARRGPHASLLVPIVGCLLAMPLWFGVAQAGSFTLSIGCLLAAYLAAECWWGATISTMQGALPPNLWGTVQGLTNFVQLLSNGSPLLVGVLVRQGYALRDVLACIVPCTYAAALCLFAAAYRARKREDQIRLSV